MKRTLLSVLLMFAFALTLAVFVGNPCWAADTQPDPEASSKPELVQHPILYVARPQYLRDHHNTATMFQTGEINTASFRGGSALRIANFAVKDANGKPEITTLLDCPEGIIRDPDVSFDGKKVLFSMRRNKDDDYHIYEINADGTGLRQITTGRGLSDIDPIYLPNGQILFSSTREPKFCMCNRHPMCNLFTMNADGSNMDQIGHSTLFEGHASVLSDGRVLYDRWEYVDRNFGDAQGLWVTNPDGTLHAIYWGNNSATPGGVIDAREIPGTNHVICTFTSCHDRPWGAIAILDRTLGIDGKQSTLFMLPPSAMANLDVESYDAFAATNPKYEDPFPLSDQLFLASRDLGNEHMGLVLFDLQGHETVILEDTDPARGVFDAMPLCEHPRPAVLESRLDPDRKASGTGTLYVSNVYEGQEMANVQPGEAKYLRVVEAPEKRFWCYPFWTLAGEQAPAMNWHDFGVKRILGTVPVEEDGSANFEIPADTFVYFQLLDEQGRMIQSMRSGTIVRPGENQGCIGCHEDRLDAVPPQGAVKAIMRPASKLELPKWLGDKPQNFSYTKFVQPIFDKHCVQCHDFDGPGAPSVVLASDRNLCFNASYESLLSHGKVIVPGAGPTKTMAAKSWGSTVSPLAKIVLYGHGDERDQKFTLTDEEKDTILTWIDLNAPYYPSFATNYRENVYGRCPLKPEEMKRLAELTGDVFVQPDEQFSDKRTHIGQVSFDRPEKSTCLKSLEPGSDAWNEALAIIRTGAERMDKRPRADMPNFQMLDPIDQKQEAKYQQYERCFHRQAR